MSSMIEKTYINPVKTVPVPKNLLGSSFRVMFEPIAAPELKNIAQKPEQNLNKLSLSELIKQWQKENKEISEDWSDAFYFDDKSEKDIILHTKTT